MSLPESLQVALKEWAVVCDALSSGEQTILLRKGGILEAIGGFELEHRSFLLFPTYLHQNAEMVKEQFRSSVERRDAEPGEITLSAAAVVSDIVKLHSRRQMDAIDAEHIWTAPLIDMRFNYRPQNPLYLLIVRAYRLSQPTKIRNTPEYAGCKSWVPLEQPIAVGERIPALDEEQFESRRQRLLQAITASQ